MCELPFLAEALVKPVTCHYPLHPLPPSIDALVSEEINPETVWKQFPLFLRLLR